MAAGGGGGGLGAGGDIFVQQGGSLTIEGGSLSGGSVTGGAGAGNAGGNGSAYGSGIFIQGDQSITFAPPADQTMTINDVIADQSGSGGTGTTAGAGALIVNGPGTVVLDATNTFTGGITLEQGTLELAAAGAAGSGPITFTARSNGALVLDAAALPAGGTFANHRLSGSARRHTRSAGVKLGPDKPFGQLRSNDRHADRHQRRHQRAR